MPLFSRGIFRNEDDLLGLEFEPATGKERVYLRRLSGSHASGRGILLGSLESSQEDVSRFRISFQTPWDVPLDDKRGGDMQSWPLLWLFSLLNIEKIDEK